MSVIKDTFFGGAEKKAAKSQQKGIERGIEATREAVNRARGDLGRLFPAAQQNLQQGFQGALDIFGQTIPQQAQAFTGGNVAAQQALLAGLSQQQNAILGGQLQPLNIQPFALQPDFGFAQQQLPEFVNPFGAEVPNPDVIGLPTIGGLNQPVSATQPVAATQPVFGGRFGGNNLANLLGR